MFTPLFYQKLNNKYIIRLGKHRIYSLLENNKINPINKKFLFIEFPLYLETENIASKEQWCELYKLRKFNMEPIYRIPENQREIFNFMNISGDTLTQIFYNYKLKPLKIFNNEIEFNNWISQNI